MLWKSSIQTENQAKPAGFQPEVQEAQAGDAIFWVNDDIDVQHQPHPAGSAAATWCTIPLSGSERSDSIALANPGTIQYLCAIHPEETGTIVVANAVAIGRTAGDEILYVPGTLSIATGDSVSWTNSDALAHQPAPIAGPAMEWFAEPIPAGEASASISFPDSGTIAYHCALTGREHENERGSIVVKKRET